MAITAAIKTEKNIGERQETWLSTGGEWANDYSSGTPLRTIARHSPIVLIIPSCPSSAQEDLYDMIQTMLFLEVGLPEAFSRPHDRTNEVIRPLTRGVPTNIA